MATANSWFGREIAQWHRLYRAANSSSLGTDETVRVPTGRPHAICRAERGVVIEPAGQTSGAARNEDVGEILAGCRWRFVGICLNGREYCAAPGRGGR